MESGKVEVSEWTNYSLSVRFKAAAAGVSFYPSRNIMGTDTFKFSGAKIIECPFTGTKYAAMPALYPDVSVIHVHESDIYGNCRARGIIVSDFDVARASKRLIITTERLISNDEIRRDPSLTDIPYWCVDAVCEVPYGAYPGNMYQEYFSDEEHIREWLKVEEDPVEFKKFIEKNIYSCKDHFNYIEKNGGMHKLLKLREKEFMFLKARD
jgi:glutaconate CoA-transferase subunit A